MTSSYCHWLHKDRRTSHLGMVNQPWDLGNLPGNHLLRISTSRWRRMCLFMGREVLCWLLMVSTEKQRNENPDISKKGNGVIARVFCGRVLCSFLPTWVRGSCYGLTLVQNPRLECYWTWGFTERRVLCLGVSWADSFEKEWVAEMFLQLISI